MTTVVYKHKTKEIGSDSQITFGDRLDNTDGKKIFRIDDCWVGFSGICADWHLLYDKLNSGLKLNGLKDLDIECIILPDKGSAYTYWIDCTGTLQKHRITGDYAVGSGSEYALGALYVGASIRDAIKASIKYDIYSSGRIVIKKKGKLK